MPKERILSKKFEQLNELKMALVSRSDMSKEEIVEKIKETVDDIEIVLEDFEYINNSEQDRHVNMRGRDRIYDTKGKEFTLSELSKYDGKEGRPSYVAVDGIVYDTKNIEEWTSQNEYGIESGKDMTRTFYQSYSKNVGILNKAEIVGMLVTD